MGFEPWHLKKQNNDKKDEEVAMDSYTLFNKYLPHTKMKHSFRL